MIHDDFVGCVHWLLYVFAELAAGLGKKITLLIIGLNDQLAGRFLLKLQGRTVVAVVGDYLKRLSFDGMQYFIFELYFLFRVGRGELIFDNFAHFRRL